MAYEGSGRRWGRDYEYGPRDRDYDRERSYRSGRDPNYDRFGRPEERGYGNPDRDREWNRDRYRSSSDDRDDRGFFDRAGDEVRSWFGDEEAERRRRMDERYEERGRGAYSSREDRDRERGYASTTGYGSSSYFGSAYTGATGGIDYGAGRGAGATGMWGLGAGRDRDVWGYDPNYHSWRERQMEALDRDYDEFRREHQSTFDQHFGTWRQTREGQRQMVRQVREHSEVVGSDGEHVGTVDAVRGEHIVLTKNDQSASGQHHRIPCAWVQSVDDKVHLNRTAEQARNAWSEAARNEGSQGLFGADDRARQHQGETGPHVLNRSFSGTYEDR